MSSKNVNLKNIKHNTTQQKFLNTIKLSIRDKYNIYNLQMRNQICRERCNLLDIFIEEARKIHMFLAGKTLN